MNVSVGFLKMRLKITTKSLRHKENFGFPSCPRDLVVKSCLTLSSFTILLVACSANSTPTTAPTTVPPTLTSHAPPLPLATPLIPLTSGNRLGPIKNYTVYYGVGQAEALSKFDLAIVQP